MITEDHVLVGPTLPEPLPEIGLGALLFEKLKENGDCSLLVEADTGRECTAGELLDLSVKAAAGLREQGVEEGDYVCLMGANCVDIIAAAVGTLYLGAIMAPIDEEMKPFEYEHMFGIIEPKIILCDAKIVESVKRAVDNIGVETPIVCMQENDASFPTFEDILVEASLDEFEPVNVEDPEEVAVLVGSSGSTGLPKAVCLTHTNMLFEIAIVTDIVNNFPKDASFLHTSYFFWVTGIFMMFTGIAAGCRRILIRDISALPVLKAIHDYKPMWSMQSPALLHSLLVHPDFEEYDLQSMKLIVAAGSPLSTATVELAKKIWKPSSPIIASAYGLSELSGCYLKLRPEVDIYSVGSINQETSLKIIDVETGANCPAGIEGEVLCKSMGQMKCYKKNPEATAEAVDEEGWLHTGDLGYFTSEGMVYITGRIKELMKLDNHQIAPAEIEALIKTVPGVIDVGVAGIKISEDSSYPMALVVKHPDSDVSEEEIVKCVNENLSDFKQLRGGVCFVDDIPRTTTGKIRRRELQNMADELYLQDSDSVI